MAQINFNVIEIYQESILIACGILTVHASVNKNHFLFTKLLFKLNSNLVNLIRFILYFYK